MPGYFIVPASLSDYQLKEAVHQYNNDRLPVSLLNNIFF